MGGWLHTEINVRHQELNPDTVTHLSTNRARRRLSSLIEANALTTTPDRTERTTRLCNELHTCATHPDTEKILPFIASVKRRNHTSSSNGGLTDPRQTLEVHDCSATMSATLSNWSTAFVVALLSLIVDRRCIMARENFTVLIGACMYFTSLSCSPVVLQAFIARQKLFKMRLFLLFHHQQHQ